MFYSIQIWYMFFHIHPDGALCCFDVWIRNLTVVQLGPVFEGPASTLPLCWSILITSHPVQLSKAFVEHFWHSAIIPFARRIMSNMVELAKANRDAKVMARNHMPLPLRIMGPQDWQKTGKMGKALVVTGDAQFQIYLALVLPTSRQIWVFCIILSCFVMETETSHANKCLGLRSWLLRRLHMLPWALDPKFAPSPHVLLVWFCSCGLWWNWHRRHRQFHTMQ